MERNMFPENLRANQRLLARELMARGIEVSLLDQQNEIVEANLGTHSELFVDIDSSIVPYASSIIAGSKSLTKKLLSRSGISVPKGSHFPSQELSKIIDYCCSALKFPLVIKPSNGIQGENVFTGLESSEELIIALQSMVNDLGHLEVIVEEQFHAHEFRIFITKDGQYAALYREPAYVIGDGHSTIWELSVAESNRRMNPRKNCLCEITLDAEAASFLRKKGMSFSSVPAASQKIYLRGSSNVKRGGVPTDVTEIVHPSVIEICRRALHSIPGLPYAGIDFMCRDIRQEQRGESYRILEINSVPGIGIHMAPGRGKPRNVAKMIVDLIFPESKIQKVEDKWAA